MKTFLEFEKSIYAKELANYRCPRYEEFPNFNMYMNQLISFLNNYLEIFLIPNEEKTITATMVNNYVKKKVIAPPINRKYSRDQAVHILVVAILKQILNISEIAKLIRLQIRQYSTSVAYNFFCEELEHSLRCTFSTKDFTKSNFKFKESPTPISETARLAVLSFSNRIYVKKSLFYSEKLNQPSKK